MKRRHFLQKSVGGLVVIVMPSLLFQTCTVSYDKSLAMPSHLASIWDVETVTSVGKQYLEQFPKEKSEQKLVKLLLKSIPVNKENSLIVDEKIIEDFKTDNTVLLDGWILSLTEARQCALFVITQLN